MTHIMVLLWVICGIFSTKLFLNVPLMFPMLAFQKMPLMDDFLVRV
jgi:hypothetical protein